MRIGRRKPLKCKICFESSDNPILHRPWSSALLLLLLPLSIIIMNPAIIIFWSIGNWACRSLCDWNFEEKLWGTLNIFCVWKKIEEKKGENMEYFHLIGTLKNIFWRIYGIFFVIGRILERRAARRRNQRPELLPCYGWFEASASVQPDFEPIFCTIHWLNPIYPFIQLQHPCYGWFEASRLSFFLHKIIIPFIQLFRYTTLVLLIWILLWSRRTLFTFL